MSIDLRKAQNLLSRGTDCLGPAEIVSAFGDSLGLKLPEEIPLIPWTEDEIKVAKECDKGVMLVLMPPSLTMQKLVEAWQNRATDGDNLLWDLSEFKGLERWSFYVMATTGTTWHWVMMTKQVIPGSAKKDFLKQTGVIANYLRGAVFAGRELPGCYAKAIAEFEAEREEIARLMNPTDWPEAAKRLSGLKLNQMCRPSPAQLLFALAVYKAVNGERLLPGVGHWSPALWSSKGLVGIGDFDRQGVLVAGRCPTMNSDNGLGVIFSRSAVVEMANAT